MTTANLEALFFQNMVPPVSTPGRSTPLSGMRARPVSDSPQASLGIHAETSGVALADASVLLERLCGEYETASFENEKHMGDMADNMTAVQNFRKLTVISLKETAGELLEAVASAKSAAQPSVTREEHEEMVYAAEKEKYSVIQEILQGQQEIARLRGAKDSISCSTVETVGKEKHIREYLKDSIPVLEAKHKLYITLSRTRIYLGNPADGDDVVTGYVSDREASEVRPFTFDLSRMSCYDAVNALWDII
jgi:hypothetical protein